MKIQPFKIGPDAALFLDRDGVINRLRPGEYVRSVADFEFEAGAVDALVFLSKIFPRIFVVTNQSGVGRGYMTEADLADVHSFMDEKVREAGGRFDKIYHCSHRPDQRCPCRKPAPGMAFWAKARHPEVLFKNSWLAGDSATDIQLGQLLGMTTVHIASKPEDFGEIERLRPDFRFGSLADFARFAAGAASPA